MIANFTGEIRGPIDSRALYDRIKHLGSNIGVTDLGESVFVTYTGELNTITHIVYYCAEAGRLECTISKEVTDDESKAKKAKPTA